VSASTLATVAASLTATTTAETRFLFRHVGYPSFVRDEAETVPERDKRPESEPTSVEDSSSSEPGEGPLDEPDEDPTPHGGWTDR
jgi:hypothetical protein